MSCIRRSRVLVPCAERALRSERTDGLGDRFTVQPFTPTATRWRGCFASDSRRWPWWSGSRSRPASRCGVDTIVAKPSLGVWVLDDANRGHGRLAIRKSNLRGEG